MWTGKARAALITQGRPVSASSIPTDLLATDVPVYARYRLRSCPCQNRILARNLTDDRDSIYPLLFGSIQHNASSKPARAMGVTLIVRLGGR